MKKLITIIIISLIIAKVSAQKTIILYSQDDNGKTYTSLSEALQEPEKVYRLKLTKLANRDSLPEELFQLTELRETFYLVYHQFIMKEYKAQEKPIGTDA